jgi:uncharacterized membrane protein YbaN (DUF454 family)
MRRHIWTGAGFLFVGIGAVGAVLPLLPTVPFLLLALFCFARGNPVWEQRLLAHPHYGPMLRDWRTRRAIPRNARGQQTPTTTMMTNQINKLTSQVQDPKITNNLQKILLCVV